MKVAEFSVEEVRAEACAELTQVLQSSARAFAERGQPVWPLASLEPDVLQATYPYAEMFLGFQDGGAVAGMVLLEDDPLFWPDVRSDESLFLHKLAVVPALQGSGVASKMLAFAATRARACGKRYLRLDTAAERPKLLTFYERHDFRLVGERTIGGFYAVLYEQDV